MAQSSIIISYLITFVIIQVVSQTVWLDVDTGKVLGVTQGQGQQQQQQQRPQQQYPPITGYHHRRHHWQQPNIGHQAPFVQQPVNPNANNVDAEWVCTNPKTGDTMIIASEIRSRLPEQTQPNYPQQPIQPYNPSENNPWLGTNGRQPQQINSGETLPGLNDPQNSISNGDNYPTALPTEAPVILTTKPTKKDTFPTLGNIDWTKYIEETTKKPTASSLNSAIDGQGIIMARNGN